MAGERWVWAAVLCLLPGCKKPRTDDKPEPNPDQLYAEQERISRGELVGEALRAPKVVVDGARVTVNGHLVATRAELGVPGGRVDKLFSWSKGLREHWRMLHPSQPFEPAVDVTAPAELSFLEGKSLTQTLAYTGFAHDMTFHVGGVSARLDYTVPGPPALDDGEPKPKPKTLELCHADDGWKARAKVFFGEREPSKPESTELVSSPWRPAGAHTLGEPIAELCANACASLEIGNASSFQEALSMAAAARDLNRHVRLTVAFTTCKVEEKPVLVPPASNGSSKLRVGATQVSGSLSAEVVTGVLGQAQPFAQKCYEDGLVRNPELTGRVSVKLVIDETGFVVVASNAGSDLPDSQVISCVVKAYSQLGFPKPEQGTVVVEQPLFFEPNAKRSRKDGG